MDIQYFGGNCISLTGKGVRIIVDDNLTELNSKAITRHGDIALFTGSHHSSASGASVEIDTPGEYEISNLSIIGIAARGHMDDPGSNQATMYKILADDVTYFLTGHVYPELNDEQLEAIGMIDVMCVPVGGNGYTLDADGALQLIKLVEPKIVVPTHYADQSLRYPVEQRSLEDALKKIGMEIRETAQKFRFKPGDQLATTQLEILTRS